jgi:tetratricopeptide (TPR) repeat protein
VRKALLLAALALGDDSSEADRAMFDALSAVRAGDYGRAAEIYEGLLGEGHDGAALRYNLGNCWARQGDYARALAQYLAAQRFAPRDPDIGANLSFVRRKLGFEEVKPGLTDTVRAWARAFTLREVVLAGLGFEFLFFGVAVARLLSRRPPPRSLAAAAGIGLLACAAWIAHDRLVVAEREIAVVLSEEGARSEPRADREEIFRVRPGAEVRVLRREGNWARVEARGAGVGWLPSASLASLQRPRGS